MGEGTLKSTVGNGCRNGKEVVAKFVQSEAAATNMGSNKERNLDHEARQPSERSQLSRGFGQSVENFYCAGVGHWRRIVR